MARIRTYPGEVLREEFNDAARPFRQCARVGIAGACDPIGDILRTEKPRAVGADLTIRLARCIGMTPDFRLNLQAAYDLSLVPTEHGAASSATFTRARSWRILIIGPDRRGQGRLTSRPIGMQLDKPGIHTGLPPRQPLRSASGGAHVRSGAEWSVSELG